MKTSFIIFTLISACLASEQMSQMESDGAVHQHQEIDLAQVMPQALPETPNVQVHRSTFYNEDGVNEDAHGIYNLLLNHVLLQNIFEYVPKSPGKMAMTCKKLDKYVKDTKCLRYSYEGLYWDMPEIVDDKYREVIGPERMAITDLRGFENEETFNDRMYVDLLVNKVFKKLSKPVLKYLIRVIFMQPIQELKNIAQLKKLCNMKKYIFDFAVRNSFYDVVFDIRTQIDPFPFIKEPVDLMSTDSYFNYYNWVYDNPRAYKYILKRLSQSFGYNSILFRYGMNLFDIRAWCLTCIHKQSVHKFFDLEYLRGSSSNFVDLIKEYLVRFSLITLDPAEMESYHVYIKKMMDIKFPKSSDSPPFLDLLNDIRFGPHEVDIYEDRIAILKLNGAFDNSVTLLIRVASKANKKDLVRQLSHHPDFYISSIYSRSFDFSDPNHFKVIFDIIETNTNQFLNQKIFIILPDRTFLTIIKNGKFEIIKFVKNLNNYIEFEIKSPKEYVALGFAPSYSFVLESRNVDPWFLSFLEDP